MSKSEISEGGTFKGLYGPSTGLARGSRHSDSHFEVSDQQAYCHQRGGISAMGGGL